MIVANERNLSLFILSKTPDVLPINAPQSYSGMKICYALSGNALWEIDGKVHEIRQGDVVFLGDRHKRRFVKFGDSGFSLCSITLHRHAFANIRHFSFFLTCMQDGHNFFHNPALGAPLAAVAQEWIEKTPDRFEMASAKLTEFFILAERLLHFRVEDAAGIDVGMLKILDYIDARITDKITLAEVAAHAGLTESSFSRWFSRCNGITFKKYIMAKKIEHAVHLLQTTDRKVIDIAYDCGFDSISGFYDTFKKYTGTTPNKFSYLI